MSRSFKTEAARKAERQRRDARRSARRAKHDNFFESHDSTPESQRRERPSHMVKK